ncbi:hypothetical protein TBR22_A17890 [Luteitalea sp. TBR-22]|uniref:TerB family tellurite resistance protein n=1 Tax=Luteitalea sp. TBR-22 TaxID=2802971 RepID=UPI001AF33D67|nr:TerB family tellurite resistance protein [Luteitalea sp. TBR-22]BCS32575.1 hypothetical protein TBR22_A17890 [Luteitalea sp. TBR-22]
MTLIDKVLQQHSTAATPLTLREAGATLLVAAVAADGALAPTEKVRLDGLLASMRLFRDVTPEHLQALLSAAVDLVGREPIEDVLTACAAVVPEPLRPALFALAVELVLVDGRIADGEKRLIDQLQRALAVDEAWAAACIDVLVIRSRA